MDFRIRKGLDLHLEGQAVESVEDVPVSYLYYVRPTDFRWLKPRLLVGEGEDVEVGTPLFSSKDDNRIVVVSPVRGTVVSIHRGERRSVEAIEIQVGEDAMLPHQTEILPSDDSETLKSELLANGLWPFLRQRPYSVIANPDVMPKALFIPCFDSSPLAPDFQVILQNREEEFVKGVQILQKMVTPATPVHLCMKADADNTLFDSAEQVQKHYFRGPHPAGNVGTHIHHIAPLDKGEVVWYIHPADVAVIGRFFLTGTLDFTKVVALTGPSANHPHYYSFTYGLDISDILSQQVAGDKVRKISGNVLTGAQLEKYPVVRFYDHQITLLPEGGEREFLGWLLPGFKKWSLSHTFMSWMSNRKPFRFNTSLHGGRRSFVMTDVYEQVFPFAILPQELLRACLSKDIEMMEELGIYEVDDEDFALCEVVCPSKTECQQIIRDGLFLIRKDG